MAKRKKRRRAKSSFKLKLKKGTVYSIGQIFFFSLAGLTVISFSRQGVVLVKLNDLLTNYFSWTTIFLPFIFLSAAFLLTKFKNPFAQPNVLVGSLLFFISFATLTRAGVLGRFSWDGVATLITPAGAFIVLLGTSVVGLIILFNTSVDQVVVFMGALMAQIRRYLVGEKAIRRADSLAKRELKVSGGQTAPPGQPDESKPKEALTPKLVSNIPGEDKVWKHPPLSILSDSQTGKADRGDIKGNAAIIEQTLESFGITARVVEVNLGPAVTQYALEVALGTKLSKITALERDLALALAAPTGTIRIEAPIPGRSLVGIELPNKSPEFVPLGKMLQSDAMQNADSKLTLALGLDVSGKPLVADLASMPHILIAGQTGSGKSVCINAFLSTLLFRAAPSEVKIVMVDPKRVELTAYNGIPHLLSPVIVEPEKVISALRWVLSEMDRRYKLFAQAGVRNINGYNEKHDISKFVNDNNNVWKSLES
ncbi:MAG: DNA translocase FtsK [Patescibacteria group bacterium]